MKVQAGWIQEYLSKNVSTKKIAEALEKSGAEIEQVLYSKKLHKNIKVGLVKKVVQHPNADRLRLAEVQAGSHEYSVVCGAPNLEKGQKVALALTGTVLPDGTRIENSTIRGQESQGMICSPMELGIGEDHSGILVLDPALPDGSTLCDIWPSDDIVDVTTPANRPDLHSVVGLAREVAAQTGGEVVWPQMTEERAGKEELSVKIRDVVRTPRYVVEKYTVDNTKPSPGWLQSRLIGSGIRPINLVVDITNFVMLELGQPLHAFDASKIKPPISVRLAKTGEKLTTLDGVTRKLTAEDLVIADSTGVIALAGVMGGLSSQITPDTKSIILESAAFDGSSVRHSALRHGLRTEASSRFERRLPVQLAPLALSRAGQLLMELSDAKPVSSVADHLHVWPWVRRIGVRPSRLTELFGAPLSQKDVVNGLQSLGFEARAFDIAKEASSHLGKPYYLGARFRTHGTSAFDCSYFIDYLYSLIGKVVGHNAVGQYHEGRPVHTGELQPGDVLFLKGETHPERFDYYYVTDPVTRKHKKVEVRPAQRKRVGHNGLYIGDGKIIESGKYDLAEGSWTELPKDQQGVRLIPVEHYLKHPSYIGARRYVDDLDSYVAVTVPWWRPDVKLEEDILEEVAKLVGYDSLPATLPPWHPKTVTFDRRNPTLWQLKEALRGLGMFEVNTYSFVSADQLDLFGLDRSRHLKLKNPLSQEQAYLRSDLLPSLVTVIAKNQRYGESFGIFEVSRVFHGQDDGELPKEPTFLGLAFKGAHNGYYEAKAAVDRLGYELGLEFDIKSNKKVGLSPIGASVNLAGKPVGRIGLVDPKVLKQLKMNGDIGFAELNLDNLLTQMKARQYRPISKFPSIVRDISLLVPDKVSWAEISSAANSLEMGTLSYLSEWRGEGIETGYRSVTVRYEMASFTKTLTDEEADERLSKLLKALRQLKITPRDQ
jgi:phenylalanyl-tRNA synthetase beta subunit